MISPHASNGLAWLDVSNPTEEDISGLVKRYGLHPLTLDDLAGTSTLSQIEFYREYIFAVIPLCIQTQNSRTYAVHTVAFIAGKNFLITIRTQPIESFDYFTRIFETNSLLKKEEKIEHAGHLFYYMLKRIYAEMHQDLRNMQDRLSTLESNLFKAQPQTTSKALARAGQEITSFKQAVRTHHQVWSSFIEIDPVHLFSKEFKLYIQDIQAKSLINREIITNASEAQTQIRASHDSWLLARQLDLSKQIHRAVLILGSLIVVAACFSIPVIAEHLLGWILTLAAIALLAGGLVWYKKRT